MLLYKLCITLKSDFQNQTYILVIFKEEMTIVIILIKNHRFLHSMTQGSEI